MMYSSARTIKKEKAKQRKMDRQKRTKEITKHKSNTLIQKKVKQIAARDIKRVNEERTNKKLRRGKKKSSDGKKLKKLDRELRKLGKKIDKEKKKLEKEKKSNNETLAMELNEAKGEMLGLARSPLKDLNQLGQEPPWGDFQENKQSLEMPDNEEYPILSPVYEGESDYDSDRTVCYSPGKLPSTPVPGSHEPVKSSDDESNTVDLSDIELDDGEGSDWLPGDDDNSSNASDANDFYNLDTKNTNNVKKSKRKSSTLEKDKLDSVSNITNNDSKSKSDTCIEDENNETETKEKSSVIANDEKSQENDSKVTFLKNVAGSCFTVSSDMETFNDNVKTNENNDDKSDTTKLGDDTNKKLDDKSIGSDVTKLKDVNKYHSISSDAEMLINDMKTVKDHEYPKSISNQDEVNEPDVANKSQASEIEMNGKSPIVSDDELPEVKLGNDSDATEPYSDADMDLDSARFRRFFSYLQHDWEDTSSSDGEESEVDQDALDEALSRMLGRPSSSKTPARVEGGKATGRKRKAPIFPPKPSKRARRNWGSEDDYGSDDSGSTLPDIEMMNEIHKVMQGTSSKRVDDKKSNKVKIPNALEEDEEEYGVAEVYDDYMPLKLKQGCQHPDPVVETASLASVEPTDITYSLGLPADTVSQGKLSALQLEAVVYSSQAHEQTLPDGSRAGFLIGDGAGVGKGRTVAGVIYENYLKGRKRAIWVSVSNDLKLDAERDLGDIGASHVKVHLLKDFKYVKLSSMKSVSEGVMFMTYSALSSKRGRIAKDACFKSRIDQLLDWCGEDFDGVIVLDECHKAKNLCPPGGKGKPTKTGLNVLKLQERLPQARLVYASATGATEPKNMAYMVRLGLWGQGTAFGSFSDFIKVVEKGGVGAMEIVAMDMKLRGMYIARQLSFRGVSFHIEEVPLEGSLTKIYNDSVKLWVEAKQQFDRAFDISGADPKMKRFMWAQFWGAHQRFFKYLCIAAKVDRAVAIALQAVAEGKCAVVGLQSTGEARTLVQLGQQTEELTEFLSTAEGVFKNLVETQFPGAKKPPSIRAAAPQLDRMRHALLAKVDNLGKRLPRNMLDDLVDKLGGADKVAEMTGRKGRLVKSTDKGHQQVHYESRCDGESTLDSLNVLEKQRFMDGDKLIAVISEAASSGISLQSDRRVPNQRRRVHITLELPWSADRAIQQFGRTHRCNQVNAPEYIFLISDLAGERRFASTVAKRLESLGALTHGDRRATETRDLSQFNIDNKYGKEALLALLQAVRGGFQRVAAPAEDKDFIRNARRALEDVGIIDADEGAYAITEQGCNMTKFLNRILGVPVKMQNTLFKYFVDNLTMVTEEAKRKGSFDQGIVDVKGAHCVRSLRVRRHHATGLAPVLLHTVLVDRGMDWDSALRKYNAENGTFYVARQGCGHRRNILLYLRDRGQVYRPGTGLQRAEPLADIERKYSKLSGAGWLQQAEGLWTRNHLEAKTVCSHAFFRTCQPGCKWGLRERTYYVLSGSVLCVWDKLEFQRLQVVRVRTLSADRIVGTLIPASCVDDIEKSLKVDAVSVETKNY